MLNCYFSSSQAHRSRHQHRSHRVPSSIARRVLFFGQSKVGADRRQSWKPCRLARYQLGSRSKSLSTRGDYREETTARGRRAVDRCRDTGRRRELGAAVAPDRCREGHRGDPCATVRRRSCLLGRRGVGDLTVSGKQAVLVDPKLLCDGCYHGTNCSNRDTRDVAVSGLAPSKKIL
jgi:hypothetical protein